MDALATAKAATCSRPSDRAPTGLAASRVDQAQGIDGEILRPRGCDDEVASIMDQLDKLQGWLVLQGAQTRGQGEYFAAARLVQNTRVLIVERCFNARQPSPATPTIGEPL